MTPVHAWFLESKRMFRSRSKEIATISISREKLCRRKEVAFDRIVCLIKVNCIHLNICLHNTMERIVGGEDDNILTHTASTVCIQVNLVCFSCTCVVRFTTVNVHHMQIWVTIVRINNLHKFRTQLLSKKNARSNNNSGGAIVDRIVTILGVHDHTHGLTTTSRHNNLTTIV